MSAPHCSGRRPSALGRSPSAAWAGGWTSSSTIKVIAMLALGIRGLVVVGDGLPRAWRLLVEALLLALLTLAFVAAAERSPARRFGWLLSASTAAGLAIAAGYRFASTAPPAATATVAVFALLLIAAYGSRCTR
jgi:hypothetical protein